MRWPLAAVAVLSVGAAAYPDTVVMPDKIEVLLKNGGWTEIDKLADGCPVPLPPGSACAIMGSLSSIMLALDAGDSYRFVRVSWTSGAHDPITAMLEHTCRM